MLLHQSLVDRIKDPVAHDYVSSVVDIEIDRTQILHLLDKAWNETVADVISDGVLGEYYSHPVWMLNGLFSYLDRESYAHRQAISLWIKSQSANLDKFRVADYGGGMGALSFILAKQFDELPDCEIELIEPYCDSQIWSLLDVPQPTRLRKTARLSGTYDFIIAQDVLEHCFNPMDIAQHILSHLTPGGFAIFINCFRPVIACHLPRNMWLRHLFNPFLIYSGYEKQKVQMVPNGHAFRRKNSSSATDVASFDRATALRAVGEFLNLAEYGLKTLIGRG